MNSDTLKSLERRIAALESEGPDLLRDWDPSDANTVSEHGFARPYADFTDADALVQVSGYAGNEGSRAPDQTAAAVSNPGYTATTDDTLVLARLAGVWTVVYVITGGSGGGGEVSDHGHARAYTDFTDAYALVRVSGYSANEGTDSPDESTAVVANPGYSATTDNTLVLAKISGTWTVTYVISAEAVDYIKTGVVEYGSAAVSARDGNDQTLGTVSVWEYLTADQVTPFNIGDDFDIDQPVGFFAVQHDSGATYAAGDLVLFGGTVRVATDTNSGSYGSGDWDEWGAAGVYFPDVDHTAGLPDPADWTLATGERFIDRTRTPLDLDNEFEGDAPVQGAIVKWIGTRLIGFGCAAQEGWA